MQPAFFPTIFTPTIFALASGSMRAGVAVVRVSGARALDTLCLLSGKKDFTPRAMHLVRLTDPVSGVLLDIAMAVYFKAPASFTGEDVVEYHLHGGRSVIEGVLAALGNMQDCRMAEPGEFTKRAFEQGKIDLTEAEAIADLIDAETQSQRLQALDQLSGHLAALYRGWSDRLSKMLAHQEAEIEFPEDDLPQGISADLTDKINQLLAEISSHLDDNRRGERLRDGVRVAIIGAPNAGKSSLLNALAARDAAIVSDIAGTTRDVIEVHLDLGGYPVILSDTAGLRDTADTIESEGIRRARHAAANADIRIALFAAGEKDAETLAMVDASTMIVTSKSDITGKKAEKDAFAVSSVTGEGLPEFLQALTQRVEALFQGRSGPTLTRARHREALVEAHACLTRSLAADLPELAAEDLRLALRALGRITGRVHVEELLDRIFHDFCIGK